LVLDFWWKENGEKTERKFDETEGKIREKKNLR
jgi:hypothetical protein